MSHDREPYDDAESETFGFVEDEEVTGEELEDDILDAEGYQAADGFGTTPEEERRGPPLDEELDAEEPDVGEGSRP